MTPNATLDSPTYRRILLKLSGESLAGESGFGLDPDTLNEIAAEIASISAAGIQIGIVIGGGNFFRGVSKAAASMDRIVADQMGMLGTVMNAMALAQSLQGSGKPSRVQSALGVGTVVETYSRAKTLEYLTAGEVVIFAAGTGNPLFTTDTAASLRAIEINADLMIKATRVDGIYDDDPEKNPKAIRYNQLSFDEAWRKQLKVMDATAFTLCRDHAMPIRVLNVHHSGNLQRAVEGQDIGTLVS